MISEIIDTILVIIAIISLFALGWFCNNLYKSISNERNINGLRFVDENSHTSALEIARQYEEYGDWVCINSKGMSYNECVETAQHECGHEIFAEILEKHPEKIEQVMEVIK